MSSQKSKSLSEAWLVRILSPALSTRRQWRGLFSVSQIQKPWLGGPFTVWNKNVDEDARHDGEQPLRQDKPVDISGEWVGLGIKSPFPTGKPSWLDSTEGECKDTADDGAEVAEKGDQHDAGSDLVRAVPVAELKHNSGPEPSFTKPKEKTDGEEALCILGCGVAAMDEAPRNLMI
jgi:hypothetical protein